jgi:formamidopyrimidine-DNA glycosylase
LPELPEVETIRRDLEKTLLGRRALEAQLQDARLMSANVFTRWRQAVLGQRWTALKRKGKYLLAELENGWHVVFHLRMTGRLVLGELPPPAKFRLAMTFDNGARLSFYDQRRFGEVWTLEPGKTWHTDMPLGPDAFTDLDLSTFQAILRGRTTAIQTLLMDQRRLAGVGNIYAQEALFKALIRPTRAAKRVTKEESVRLYEALVDTLRRAIEHRGSTSRDYRDAYGEPGRAQTLHAVYRKGGAPCPRCEAPLRSARVGGRGTVYCPRCQR